MQKEKPAKLIRQILLLASAFIMLLENNAFAANGVTVDVESLFIPLGKANTTTDTRTLTLLYGVKGFSEISENWRISYGVSTTVLNGFLTSFPLSIAYVPSGDYKFNLRPQIFAGIEPFYSNFPDFQGFRLYGHVGLGLDYIVNNNWIVNAGAKMFINDSFFKSSSELKTDAFNSGTLSVYLGFGYKFL